MFEVAEIGRKIAKAEFRKQEPKLRAALLEAQRALRERGIAVVVLVAGVDGAGKSETVNVFSSWMDPRGLEVNTFGTPSDEERERPRYWRFWRSLPPRGRIGIYFGSWYTDPILSRVEGDEDDAQLAAAVQDIRHFERQLADDGVVLVKLWFHLGKKAQKRRLKALAKDRTTRWRVRKQDWARLKRYDQFLEVSATVIQETSLGHAPWTIIEGADHEYRSVTAARTLLDAVAPWLAASKPRRPRVSRAPAVTVPAPHQDRSLLDSLDLGRKLSKKNYEAELEDLYRRLNRLARQASRRGRSAVIVYEGMDAAGKGGNIRRLTAAMDARHYRVIPIAAPTDEERAQPYLWRFWRHLPRTGRLTIFDRSWYGRVLVERVEGFADPGDWQRAYGEINEFEEQLHRHDVVLVKFWLQISKEEQLRRFGEREKVAYKRYKITAEDWRNRKRWDSYVAAVEEMVARTSTPFAPWTLIEGNDKYWARVKTLRTVVERFERLV